MVKSVKRHEVFESGKWVLEEYSEVDGDVETCDFYLFTREERMKGDDAEGIHLGDLAEVRQLGELCTRVHPASGGTSPGSVS
jgi:hypothetical protein